MLLQSKAGVIIEKFAIGHLILIFVFKNSNHAGKLLLRSIMNSPTTAFLAK